MDTPSTPSCVNVSHATGAGAVLVEAAMKQPLRLVLAVTALLVGACSDDHSHTTDTGRPVCTEIFERCHPLDPGVGPIHDCHEFAEDEATTNAQCSLRRTECFTTCTVTDAGADAGAQDAARDVASGG